MGGSVDAVVACPHPWAFSIPSLPASLGFCLNFAALDRWVGHAWERMYCVAYGQWQLAVGTRAPFFLLGWNDLRAVSTVLEGPRGWALSPTVASCPLTQPSHILPCAPWDRLPGFLSQGLPMEELTPRTHPKTPVPV